MRKAESDPNQIEYRINFGEVEADNPRRKRSALGYQTEVKNLLIFVLPHHGIVSSLVNAVSIPVCSSRVTTRIAWNAMMIPAVAYRCR
jgi:hypothetical protein